MQKFSQLKKGDQAGKIRPENKNMKYIVYVKEYINRGITRDYIYSEYSGIKHDTKEDAEKEVQDELIKFIFPDYYIAEED